VEHIKQRDRGSAALEPTRGQQPLEEPALARADFRPADPPVPSPPGKGANCPLPRIGLHRALGSRPEDLASRCALQGIAGGLGAGIRGQAHRSTPRLVEPEEEGRDAGLRPLPTGSQFGLGRQAVLPDVRRLCIDGPAAVESVSASPGLGPCRLHQGAAGGAPALRRAAASAPRRKARVAPVPVGEPPPAALPSRLPPHRLRPGGGAGAGACVLRPVAGPARARRELAFAVPPGFARGFVPR
jgi:hypothetical protein